MRKQHKAVNTLKISSFVKDILKKHEVTVKMLRLSFACFLPFSQYTTKIYRPTNFECSNFTSSK